MINIRVLYTKKDHAKYISHLDVNRLMQRVLKRSSLPVWYTEGFNPHMYITFALPLSLGYESEYEIMDLRLIKHVDFNEVKNILNKNLPTGIEVLSVFEPIDKPSSIVSSEYIIELFSETISTEQLEDKLKEFMLKDELIITKKTKKGQKQMDIKPFINIKNIIKNDENLTIQMELPAGVNSTINPTLFTDSFNEYVDNKIYLTKVKRTKIFCENGKLFS